MAHFAKINQHNIVDQVIVVSNETLQNTSFPESETIGIQFLNQLYGHTNWKQTSYNGNFRTHFAGYGYYYDKYRDAFIPPRPDGFLSWKLNEETLIWEAPVPYPNDGKFYKWNENELEWKISNL